MGAISHLRVGVLAPALALAFSAAPQPAFGYWAAAGEGGGSAGLATLAAPTITRASAGPETVELSWSTVAPPGSGLVEYYVTRDGGTPTGCPSVTSRSTVTSCTDTGVAIGAHKYRVIAVWRSWTAASEEASVTVSFGAVTHLQLEAASTTLTPGQGDNLTITAKDASNNTVTSYVGMHRLTFEGASSAPSGAKPTVIDEAGVARSFGEATEINFAAGKAIVASGRNGVLKLYKAEEAHIVVKEGTLSSGAGLAVTVSAGATKKLAFSGLGEVVAGSAFGVTLTASDEYGNTTTSYAGTKTLSWSGPASSPSGRAPEYPSTATSVTFTSGVGKPTGIKLFAAGATTLTVKEGTLEPSSTSLTVQAGAFKRIAWKEPRTEPAGKITSALCLFECTAEGLGSAGKFDFKVMTSDEWGNAQASHGAGSKTIKLTSSCASCSLSASTLTIAEGASSSAEATFTGASNLSWTATLEAIAEGAVKASASLKH
jgi:hypothetical protein